MVYQQLKLTKSRSLTKFGRVRADMTWLIATWVLVPLGKAALSAAAWLLRLSTSDAEDEGDSPKH